MRRNSHYYRNLHISFVRYFYFYSLLVFLKPINHFLHLAGKSYLYINFTFICLLLGHLKGRINMFPDTLFFNLFFYWRIIALQIFVVFCQILIWFSYRNIYIFSPFLASLPSPSPSHPSRLIQSPCLSFLRHTANLRWLCILHMVM